MESIESYIHNAIKIEKLLHVAFLIFEFETNYLSKGKL